MPDDSLKPEKLFAWCIVPFDSRHRTPEERAQMLKRLGLHAYVYDWREEHIPEFETEIETMLRHGIEIFGWWLSRDFQFDSRRIIPLLDRYGIRPQLWFTSMGDPVKVSPDENKRLLDDHYARIEPYLDAAGE